MTIDEFLRSKEFSLETGHLGPLQKEQFKERLSRMPQIRRVAEIGFNAGHSAESFFEHCKQLEGLVSFDINFFHYTKPAADYLQKLHPNRFLFIEGDSLIRVPEFAKHFPGQTFDLIYIDGSHRMEHVMGDIANAKLLAHPKTILWLDDYHHKSVQSAVQFCEMMGIFQIQEIISSKNPDRAWVEAKYF